MRQQLKRLENCAQRGDSSLAVKSHLLLTTIAAVLLVGCGPKAPKGSVHIYAKEGDIVAVKQHLAAGTDVNAKDDYIGMTILQSAALGGQKEIVELLIVKGADSARGIKPEPPAANAIDPWDKWLRSIHRAAQNGNIEDVKQHIAGGTDVNAKASGYTPLHNAAEFGRVGAGKKIAELLIAAGADVNAKDRYGETPLDAAPPYSETADLLRKHGGKTKKELEAEEK